MSARRPVTDDGSRALQEILRRPEETMLAVDFAGTLAPIVDDPEQAYANPDAVAALGRLAGLVKAVVVITGRPVRTAVRLGRFADTEHLQRMTVLGQYG